MTLSRTLLAAAAAAALLSGGAALAGDGHGKDPKERVEMLFERIDTNQDGQITREEVEVAVSARFAEADTDGDGRLSQAEVEAVAVAKAVEMLKRKDQNGDGYLTPDEMDGNWALRMFERADANKDGVVTREEAEAAMSRHHKSKSKD